MYRLLKHQKTVFCTRSAFTCFGTTLRNYEYFPPIIQRNVFPVPMDYILDEDEEGADIYMCVCVCLCVCVCVCLTF
jgi:hypothetical protein